MSQTVTLYANKTAWTKQSDPTVNFRGQAQHMWLTDCTEMFVGFDASYYTSLYPYRTIYGGDAYGAAIADDLSHSLCFYIHPLFNGFTESNITYNNKPTAFAKGYKTSFAYRSSVEYLKTDYTNDINGYNLHYILKNGALYATNYGGKGTTYGASSSMPPYITFIIGDGNAYIYPEKLTPASGYVPKTEANTFSWSLTQDTYSLAEITATSTKFRYRAQGAGTYTEIDVGSATSYTIPSGTFTANNIQWQVAVTDSTGSTHESDWVTLSTSEVLPESRTSYPKNEMIDGASPIEFTWEHIISTGTAQSSAELQYSADNSTWSTLATVTGSDNHVTVAAGTFTSGEKYWRVRTANADGQYGEWSASASFLIISKPPTPSVTSEQNPKPKISWQSSDQQAYQVEILDRNDNVVFTSGTLFGIDTAFQCRQYLEDGTYTAKVRVENQYSLWSEWGIATINVTHTEGDPIVLTASGDNWARLEWTTSGSYSEFVVYRDGNAIAKTENHQYDDMFALGEHVYWIRGIYSASYNYGISETVSVRIKVKETVISDVETINWMRIPYASTSLSGKTVTENITYSRKHITGSKYPVFELSQFHDKSIMFEVAFKNQDEINRFDALFGKTVCLKTKDDEMIIGPIVSKTKMFNGMITVYSVTLEMTNWEEGIEL